MDNEMDTNQKQSPQKQLQFMEILQMSAQELEAYIENLAMENPVIEFPESECAQSDPRQIKQQRKLDWLESTDQQNRVYYQEERTGQEAQENWQDSSNNGEELGDYLLSQLLLANYGERERALIRFLILSLDERGYFTDDLQAAAARFGVPGELAARLLQDIQALDPAGVGARSLSECLLLQLDRRQEEDITVRAIIGSYMDDMAEGRLAEIAAGLGISVEEVQEACAVIRTLNPKPGSSFSSREQLSYISPDAVVVKLADRFDILINEYQYPQITISPFYQEMGKNTEDAEARAYLQEKIDEADWVSHCILQRASILSRIMHTLVERQNDFFRFGIGHRRPLELSALAGELGVPEGTASRAMYGKYLQCSWGIFPLNYFLVTPGEGEHGFE